MVGKGRRILLPGIVHVKVILILVRVHRREGEGIRTWGSRVTVRVKGRVKRRVLNWS